MKRHMIVGGGGLRLHVIEAGNAQGQPLLFIHGFSQGWYAWTRQIDSDLSESFRLVARARALGQAAGRLRRHPAVGG